MTATLTAPEPLIATRTASPYRVTFPRLLRAEWIKFVTVRSTWWSLALVALVSVGLSLLQALALATYAGEDLPTSAAEVNATAVMVIVYATILTQLLAVIIGAIAVTGEYSTGMIRSTLTAAPGRIGAALAKALVVAVVLFVFSLIVFVIAALVTAPLLPHGGLDLSDPASSVMPLLGAALYLAMIGVLGVGLGFIIRNGPGALAVGVSLVFVAPIVAMFFPGEDEFAWLQHAAGHLPASAGQSLFMGAPMSGVPLEMWPALITVIAWGVAALLAGAVVLKSRDA